MYVKSSALFSNTTFLCVTIIMFLSISCKFFSEMITYMLMIVNTAVQKTRNSHVEKLLSTKNEEKTQAISEIKNRFKINGSV